MEKLEGYAEKTLTPIKVSVSLAKRYAKYVGPHLTRVKAEVKEFGKGLTEHAEFVATNRANGVSLRSAVGGKSGVVYNVVGAFVSGGITVKEKLAAPLNDDHAKKELREIKAIMDAVMDEVN